MEITPVNSPFTINGLTPDTLYQFYGKIKVGDKEINCTNNPLEVTTMYETVYLYFDSDICPSSKEFDTNSFNQIVNDYCIPEFEKKGKKVKSDYKNDPGRSVMYGSCIRNDEYATGTKWILSCKIINDAFEGGSYYD